jgi:transcriptional regulator with XRE-family HTH domain
MSNQEYLKQVGMEIRIARVRKGISQVEISRLTGLSTDSIGGIELGKTDSQILTYKRICESIGVSLKDIL